MTSKFSYKGVLAMIPTSRKNVKKSLKRILKYSYGLRQNLTRKILIIENIVFDSTSFGFLDFFPTTVLVSLETI